MSIFRKNLSTNASLLVLTATIALAAPAKKAGYEGYALVRARNIFDPERQPGITETSAPSPSPAPPSTAADYAALTGTMLTAEKALAFFSGSRPEFNKVLVIGGTIAGATLIQINASSIEVEREGKRIVILVGQTVPLNASSVPGAAPAPSSQPAFASPTNTTSSTTTAAPTLGSADREALMRRMMEKRQQELK